MNALPVTFHRILARPEDYDGKIVRTLIFFYMDNSFEGRDTAFLSHVDYENDLVMNGTYIDWPDKEINKYGSCNKRYCYIECKIAYGVGIHGFVLKDIQALDVHSDPRKPIHRL